MKSLFVRQPWAQYILDGRKRVEFRTWQTDYRGTLVICASSQLWPQWREVDRNAPSYPRGVTLCLVTLEGIKGSPGDYEWLLRGVAPIAQIAVKGHLMLRDFDPSLVRRVGLETPSRPHPVSGNALRVIKGGRSKAPRKRLCNSVHFDACNAYPKKSD